MTLGTGNKKFVTAPFRIFGRNKKGSSELKAGSEQTGDVVDDHVDGDDFHFVEENPGSPFQRLSSNTSSSCSSTNTNNNHGGILRQSSYRVKKADPPEDVLSSSRRHSHSQNNHHHPIAMSRKQTPPVVSTRKLEHEIKELKKMIHMRSIEATNSAAVGTAAAATPPPAAATAATAAANPAGAVIPVGRTWSQATRHNLEGALWRSNSSPRGDGGADNNNNMDLQDLKLYEAIAQQLRQSNDGYNNRQASSMPTLTPATSSPSRRRSTGLNNNKSHNDFSSSFRVPADEGLGASLMSPSNGLQHQQQKQKYHFLEPLESLLLDDDHDDDEGHRAEEQHLRKHVRFFGSRKERALQEEKMNEYNTSDDDVVETWGWELKGCNNDMMNDKCFNPCQEALDVCFDASCIFFCIGADDHTLSDDDVDEQRHGQQQQAKRYPNVINFNRRGSNGASSSQAQNQNNPTKMGRLRSFWRVGGRK